MFHFTERAPSRNRFAWLAAAAFLAGCAGQSENVIPPQAAAPSGRASIAFQLAGDAPFAQSGPPACKGQQKTQKYATLSGQGISTKGGSVCVPAFGTWGGALQFPGASVPAQVTLTSSTTAYEPGLFPPAGSKTPVFYLQLKFSASLTFGSNLPAGNAIASPKVVPKKPYTVVASLAFGSLWQNLGSCYSTSKKSKYGGGVGRAGAVFLGKHPTSSSVVIEIYAGKLVPNKC